MKVPALCTAAALALSLLPCSAGQVFRTPLDSDGSVLEVTSVFETLPPTGYAPVRVKLLNNSTAPQSASLKNTSSANSHYGSDHELESSFSLSAQPKSTVEREFMVPLCTDVSQSAGYGSLKIEVQAAGRSDRHMVEAGGVSAMPFTGFSAALAAKSIAELNRYAASLRSSSSPGWGYGRQLFATLYTISQLPSDWRGLSGLDVLAMTSDEWLSLSPGVRTAVLQWVKLGGVLDMYLKSGAPRLEAMGIKTTGGAGNLHGGTGFQLGGGMVSEVTWSGSELKESVVGNYSNLTFPVTRQGQYSNSLGAQEQTGSASSYERFSKNPLVQALGEKSFAAWQVGLILLIFGIVVGPVNLFYLAGAGRRHRLFFTTPLISVAAAGLLLLVIFFQDGIGGKGHRASLVYLDAAENAAYVHQFQVCRTGVLFGGSFTTADSAVVNLAVMPDTRWTRLKSRESYGYSSYSRSGGGDAQRYTVSEKSYGGDWFQSRSEQALIVDTVQSTRGRIEVKPGGDAPVITSTLTAPLKRLFYIDAQGKYWTSPSPVTTGASITLTASSESAFLAWQQEAISMLPFRLREGLKGRQAKEFFYALSLDPGAGTVATLDSIDWESDTVFLFGPLR
jgi:hypothetical protein